MPASRRRGRPEARPPRSARDPRPGPPHARHARPHGCPPDPIPRHSRASSTFAVSAFILNMLSAATGWLSTRRRKIGSHSHHSFWGSAYLQRSACRQRATSPVPRSWISSDVRIPALDVLWVRISQGESFDVKSGFIPTARDTQGQMPASLCWWPLLRGPGGWSPSRHHRNQHVASLPVAERTCPGSGSA